MMSLCASCGLQLVGPEGMCSHHHQANGEDWAATNRKICDWLHRGVLLQRLSLADRDETPWTSGASEEG